MEQQTTHMQDKQVTVDVPAERMQEDVERFTAALRAGALLPEDF